MTAVLRFAAALMLVALFWSCATQSPPTARTAGSAPKVSRVQKVRTTAYTNNEGGSGGRNAIGQKLATGNIKSAGADWSRFPLGTRFRVVQTGEQHIIDDYGTALIGTSTIDLYKPSRAAVRKWGVRRVDIEILQWGSDENSLKVLAPRKKQRSVRRMIVALEKKSGPIARSF